MRVIFWLMFSTQLAALVYGVVLLHKLSETQIRINEAFAQFMSRTFQILETLQKRENER